MRVFSLDGSWERIGNGIIGEENGDEFGYSVSLSRDGKTIAAGARYNGGNGVDSGQVRVYGLSLNTRGSWAQLGLDINGQAAGDESGTSVSLSADGKKVVIGSPKNDDKGLQSGQVRVFRW